ALLEPLFLCVSLWYTYSLMSYEFFTGLKEISRSLLPSSQFSLLKGKEVAPKAIHIGALLFVIALSLTWLLPNHYRPWQAFHSDAWAAFVCGLTAFGIIF